MPGLDKSLFINLRESDDELLCGICLAVLDNPMVTHCCRQTYCKECITPWLQTRNTCPNDRRRLTIGKLSQPPRSLINILNKLRLTCDFQSIGCNDEVLYESFKSHIRDCKYNPEAICGDCGTKNGQRSEHNCVQILLTKNEQKETVIRELLEQKGLLETEIINTKRSTDETIQKLEIEKNNILKENLGYKEMNTNLKAALFTANQKNAIHLNEFKRQINDLQNSALRCDKAIAAKMSEMKPIHESLQLKLENIDEFFEREQSVYGPVFIEYGFEWRLKVDNKNVDQCKYLGLYLEHKRIACNELWTKLSIDYSIVRQYTDGENAKNKLKTGWLEPFRNSVCYGYSDFIESNQLFDSNNHYIKDNSIILDVTISSFISPKI